MIENLVLSGKWSKGFVYLGLVILLYYGLREPSPHVLFMFIWLLVIVMHLNAINRFKTLRHKKEKLAFADAVLQVNKHLNSIELYDVLSAYMRDKYDKSDV